MKFCWWNHYAFPGWHVQVGRAGKKSQTPSPAFQGIRFQLACSFLLCFFLLDGAKVERWECQKVAGDIFSAVECKKITTVLGCLLPSLTSSHCPKGTSSTCLLSGYFRTEVSGYPGLLSFLHMGFLG